MPVMKSAVADRKVPERGRSAPRKTANLTVEGRTLEVSNLDKVLYPKNGFTKGDVINYYIHVAHVLLPHLRDRPLTLKRYPNGVEGEFFYEKRCPGFRPSWLKTAPVWSEGNQATIHFCLANDLPSLVWAANLADLELHTSLGRRQKIDRPTAMVFDLDPGPGADILKCAEVGLALRELLQKKSLKSFAKTSGSKGLQIYVPLNTTATFDQTKACARTIAEKLARERPEKVVSQMAKKVRQNKVYIDWVQNDPHKTTVCVYSLRAKENPTVSTPVAWDEVEKALKKGRAADLVFQAPDVIDRVKRRGDLFAPVLELKQKLPAVSEFEAG
ncbi:MAG: bifunctional non-ous end joining protein LigD [Verrucomicrobiota bacterium]|jgi:bifunctional non-homologous end joining protein LigD